MSAIGVLAHKRASLTVEPAEEDVCVCMQSRTLPARGDQGRPRAQASMHKPDGQSVVTSTVAASARLCLHPAPCSHILCPQRQMAGHSLNLFKIVNPFLEAALLHSAVTMAGDVL